MWVWVGGGGLNMFACTKCTNTNAVLNVVLTDGTPLHVNALQEVEGGKIPISQRLGKIRRDTGEKSVRKGGGGGGGKLSVTVNLS
jgi:hypothetical protein